MAQSNIYREMVEFASEGLIYQEASGEIKAWNNCAEKIFGVKTEEAVGQTSLSRDWKLVFDDGTPCPSDQHPSMITLATGKPLIRQVRGIKRGQNDIIWLSINTRPIFRQGMTTPHAVIISFSDITDLKKHENALRASEDKFQKIFEHTPVLMSISTLSDGTYLDVNQKFCDVTGFDRSDVIGKTSVELGWIAQNDRVELVEELASSSRVVEKELTLRAKDGRRIHCVYNGETFAINGQQFLISTAVDITERKETEDKLRESEKLYRLVTDNSSDVIWIRDLDLNLTYVSPSVESVRGYTPSEALAQPIEEVLAPESLERAVKGFHQVVKRINDGEDIRNNFTIDLEHYCKGGTTKVFECNLSLLFDDGGKPSGILGVSRDISSRKKIEMELRNSEATYRNLLNGIPDIVMRFDRDGRHLFVSPNVEEVVDMPAAEFLGKRHRDLGFPEEMCQYWERAIRNVFDSGALHEDEFSYEGINGKRIFNWRLIPELNAQEKVQTVLSICRDVTQARRAQKDYQTLFKEMTDGFALHEIICDAEGKPADYRFLAVNPAFERLTGLKAEKVVGRTVLELMPDTEQYWIETYGVVALTGKPVNFENYSQAIGKYYAVHAFRPAAGQFACLFADITSRRQIEEALRKSEANLLEAQRLARIGSWEYEAAAKLSTWSPEMFRIFGLDPAEGEPDWERLRRLVHPDDWNLLEEAVSASTKRGKPYSLEYRIIRPDGEIRWVWHRGQVVKDNQEKVVRLYGTLQDITPSKLAEEELLKSEDRYRLLATLAPGGIYQTDREGHCIYANEAWLTMAGLSFEEALGDGWVRGLHPDDRDSIGKGWYEMVASGDRWDHEYRFQTPEGKTTWIYGTARPFYNPEGEVAGYLGMNLDISDQKKSDEEKARLEAQLAQARKMDALGTLASGIAHDFNNILAAIMGYSELARDELSENHMVRHDIMEIIKAASKAKQLVQQILTFSRKSDADQKPASLNGIVRDAIGMIGRTIPKMIRLELDIDKRALPLMANPQQIEQIIINLVTNGADAINGTGTITIATSYAKIENRLCTFCGKRYSGDYAVLSVKDTGGGMSPEIVSKIFDPFFTTKEVGKGTGLGLSTVYGVVKGHNGHINCISQLGQGTEFQIYLPLLDEELKDTKGSNQETLERLQGDGTILVVDDEEVIRDIANKILARNGYEVLLAETGERALEIYRNRMGDIDGVVLDLNMPGMGGNACLRELRKLDSEVKVLIASGYIQYENTNELRALGAWGEAFKPYRKLELLQKVHAMLSDKIQGAN